MAELWLTWHYQCFRPAAAAISHIRLCSFQVLPNFIISVFLKPLEVEGFLNVNSLSLSLSLSLLSLQALFEPCDWPTWFNETCDWSSQNLPASNLAKDCRPHIFPLVSKRNFQTCLSVYKCTEAGIIICILGPSKVCAPQVTHMEQSCRLCQIWAALYSVYGIFFLTV